ncbi:MAG: hypothetical protein R3D51_17740 [Hyphomicrobiaceae bacterium]
MKSMDGDGKETLVVDHVGDDFDWSIPSSSGRENLTFVLARTVFDSGYLVLSIRYDGDFWQRELIRAADPPLITDFRLQIAQVAVAYEALKVFADELKAVSSDPTKSIGGVRAVMDASIFGQKFSLVIGRKAGVKYAGDYTSCAMMFTNGKTLTIDASFIVDQTCIRVCAESLDGFLGRVEATLIRSK